jgi:hypothetical protein
MKAHVNSFLSMRVFDLLHDHSGLIQGVALDTP